MAPFFAATDKFLCPSSQKIGSLAGPCGNASQFVRGWWRRFGTAEIANQGRIANGMQAHRNASRPIHNRSNKKTAKKPKNASRPYVPLPGFGLPGSGLCCRWMLQSVALGLQTVAHPRAGRKRLQAVHKLFADGCTSQKKHAIRCPDRSSPFPL